MPGFLPRKIPSSTSCANVSSDANENSKRKKKKKKKKKRFGSFFFGCVGGGGGDDGFCVPEGFGSHLLSVVLLDLSLRHSRSLKKAAIFHSTRQF